MANWNTLKTAVAGIINANGNQAITGQLLQNVLNNIITNVGENATFAGIATLATNPGAPDGPVFYLTTTAGTYPNFNGAEVQDGEVVMLLWNNNAWSKKVTGFAAQEKLSQLSSEVFTDKTILKESFKSFDKTINDYNEYSVATSQYYAGIADISFFRGGKIIVKPQNKRTIVAFLRENIEYKFPLFASGEFGRHICDTGNEYIFTVPTDCTYMYCLLTNDGIDAYPNIECKDIRKGTQEKLTYAANLYTPLWYRGTIDTSSGKTANLIESTSRCIAVIYNGSDFLYKVNYGYQIGIRTWSGYGELSESSGWKEGSGKFENSAKYAFVSVRKKGDGDITIEDVEKNVKLDFGVLGETIETLHQEIDNINECIGMIQPQFIQGGLTESGDSVGKPYDSDIYVSNAGNPMVLNERMEMKYTVNKGFVLGVGNWDGVSNSIESKKFYAEQGIYRISHKYTYIVIRKEDRTALTVEEAKSAVKLQFINTDVLTNLSSFDDKKLEISWQQGTVQDKGPEVGTPQHADARVCARLQGFDGTKLYINVATGFRCALQEWNGVDTTITKKTGWNINSFMYIPTERYTNIIISKIDNSGIRPSEVDWDVVTFGEFKDTSAVYQYNGEKVQLNRFTVKPFIQFDEWTNMQGGAIYGNKLVCMIAADEYPSTYENGFIYDLVTKERIALHFSSTLNGIEYTLPHANQISFGNQFYGENSAFPLLYVSQVNGSNESLWQRSERGILVYDIRLKDGVYSAVLVQVIKPNLNNEELLNYIGRYTPNYVVNPDDNTIVIIGYPNESWYDLSGEQPISTIYIPDPYTDVFTYDVDSIIDSFKLNKPAALQQSFIQGWKLYSACGTFEKPALRVVDLRRKEIMTEVDLLQIFGKMESQFLGIYNESRMLYYTAGNDGYIYEFVW